MFSHSQILFRQAGMKLALVTAVVSSLGTFAAAQDRPAPKWEIYGGYSFFYPDADVHGLLPGGVLPVSSRLESNPRGAGASITYNFNRWLGLSVDGSAQKSSGETGVAERVDDVSFFNTSVGPKFTYRTHYFSPFLEVLGGWHRLTSDLFQRDDRFGLLAGGGLDLNLSRHFVWRMFRADYVFSNHQYGPEATVPATDIRGARLQSGIVLRFGYPPDGPPVSASCAVQPSEFMAGEPATATVTGSGFHPRHSLNYTWMSTGGTISGTHDTATLDTNGVPGGSYTVTAHVSDPHHRKGGEASCMATFYVKEPPKNPPEVSCSASPSSVTIGNSSTIQCSCTSPDHVAVTVGAWTANGGSVSASGANVATLNTYGASAGLITVSASCSDSRGLNTQAAAQVMVENPPPPPVSAEFLRLETRLALHSIYFATAKPRVEKPDGGLLESQQQTLLSLAEDFKKYLETKPEAHLTLEGHADPRGTVEYNQALSERRVDRLRRLLIERGVPAANIETKTFGEQKNLTEAQVRDAIERNPELTSEQRARVLDNLQTVLLASNRRVDITLSTTGQKSVREFPFNAVDSLALLQQEATKKPGTPTAGRKARPKVRP